MVSTTDNILVLMTIIAILLSAATLEYGTNVGLAHSCGAGSFCGAPR